MTSSTFRVGVLGTGIMGRRMLAALQAHPRFQVVAAWDPDTAALRSALATETTARLAASADDLIDDPAVDVVYVASPPSLHASAVRGVLDVRRACFCEKPLTDNTAEAMSIRDTVLASGLPFAVNFPFASAPASRRLIEIVRSGDIGKVRSASVKLRFARWPRDWQAGASGWLAGPAEGGFTREVLSHFVFQALRLFGPAYVADVELKRAAGMAETALRARMIHGDVEVQIDAAVAGDISDDNRFEVIGELGTVALKDWHRLEYQGQTSNRVDSTALTLDGLADMLEGRLDHGLATVEEAASVVQCVESMLLP